jgi:hypothetical protein
MSRPQTLDELEAVYSTMNGKWINSPEKWSIDPTLELEDTRTCLAIYTLDKCKLTSFTWKRLLKWLEPLLPFGIVYTNYPTSHEGLLHFTFHQLSPFSTIDKTSTFNTTTKELFHQYLKQLSGLHILFRGLLVTPTGIALRGYPSDTLQLQKLMNTRNELETVMKKVNLDYTPPYINDICHSTLFRWKVKPSQELIEYIQTTIHTWNEAHIGELIPKSWCIGAGTLRMQEPNRRDFENFYCPTFIAHRGLLNGSDKIKENALDTLKERCFMGLYSECDIWFVKGELFLGHDSPTTRIRFEDIHSPYLFLHAKNKDAYEYLLNKVNYEGFNLTVFWHTTEDYVLTNRGDSIVYPGKELLYDGVFMMPENSGTIRNTNTCKYICSDFKFKE